MDFEMQPYIVYVKPDAKNRIQAVNSSAFLLDTTGWREIDRGFGDRYHHAQGNYFPKPIYDHRGIHRYMTALLTDNPDREACCIYEYEGEQWGIYERTQAEMDADWVEPVPQPDQNQRIAALEEQLVSYEAAYAEGVNEA
jgi:hypothetical protein